VRVGGRFVLGNLKAASPKSAAWSEPRTMKYSGR
jgi:hypothetical protein